MTRAISIDEGVCLDEGVRLESNSNKNCQHYVIVKYNDRTSEIIYTCNPREIYEIFRKHKFPIPENSCAQEGKVWIKQKKPRNRLMNYFKKLFMCNTCNT